MGLLRKDGSSATIVLSYWCDLSWKVCWSGTNARSFSKRVLLGRITLRGPSHGGSAFSLPIAEHHCCGRTARMDRCQNLVSSKGNWLYHSTWAYYLFTLTQAQDIPFMKEDNLGGGNQSAARSSGQTDHSAEKRELLLRSERGMHWGIDLIGREYASACVECQYVYRMSWVICIIPAFCVPSPFSYTLQVSRSSSDLIIIN